MKNDRKKSAQSAPQPQKPPPLPNPLHTWLAAALLAIVAFACYLPSLNNGILNWDDDKYVTDNFHLHSGLTAETAQWAFTSFKYCSNWHPLTWLSHAADVSIFGLNNAAGQHLTNLILHALNTALLLIVLCRLTRHLWPSVIVAALFALHPLHVESVSWIAERKDVLSTFFMFLTLWAYVAYVERPDWRRYVLIALAFAAALLSKPMAVTLPCVLLVLDYWPLHRLSWRALYEKVPLAVMMVISGGLTYHAQDLGGAVRPADSLSEIQRFDNAVYGYVAYLFKAVWPYPGTLVPYYPLSDRGGDTVNEWIVMAFVILLCGLTALAFKFRGRQPYLLAGWLLYVGMLVPVIGLVQVGKQVMADRYTYVPLVGIFVAVVWLIADALARRPRAAQVAAFALALLICAGLGGLTWRQQAIWKNPITFWTAVVDAYPKASQALNNLGHAHYLLGNEKDPALKADAAWHMNQALAYYARAVDAEPNDYESSCNYANNLLRAKRLDEAERYFRRTITLKDAYAPGHNGYGSLLMQQGKTDEARAEFQRAFEIDPDYYPAQLNLAAVAMKKQNYVEAEQLCRRVISRWPNQADAWEKLGIALEHQHKMDEAARCYARAAQLGANSATRVLPTP